MQTLSFEEDLQAVQEACEKAKSGEEKVQISVSICDAALKAKDWQTAHDYSAKWLQQNTPATIRSESGNPVFPEQQVQDAIVHNRVQALIAGGKALTIKGDYGTAIESYREAGEFVSYNFTGYPNYPYWDFNLLWAQTLLQKGDYQAAIEKIAVDAVIFEQVEAQKLLKEAYGSAGLGLDVEGFAGRTRTKIAKAVPQFFVIGYDGKRIAYKKLKGKVTLLSVWSPSCAPCRAELPRLKPLYDSLHGRGLEIVAVDSLNDTKNALQFIKETGLPYQFSEAGHEKGVVERGLFDTTNPTSYLIDKTGRLVYAHHGYLEGDEKTLRNKILQSLNN